MVTTSTFSAQAKEVAIDQPLDRIEGVRLVDLLGRHEVTARRRFGG